jgi:hypothetical protein
MAPTLIVAWITDMEVFLLQNLRYQVVVTEDGDDNIWSRLIQRNTVSSGGGL